MLQNHHPSAAGMDADDLQMLQGVFDTVCERRGIAKNTAPATDVAADLISMFQHGIRRKDQLLAVLSGTRDFP